MEKLNCKSLMIGDWVSYGGTPIKVENVYEDCINFQHDIPFVQEEFLIEQTEIEPIPLTPEILEKNGWERTKYCYGRDCMEIHGADELPEGVNNALYMARWSIDKNYQYHFLELYMWKGNVMQYNIHYVHQFQHAFRLFGIEKEIIL